MAGATWTAKVAAVDPVAPAVIADRVTGYGALLGMAGAAGALLDELGLPAGSVVPALVDAGPTACALWIAGAASRRPLAPLSARSTVAELSRCLLPEDAPVVLADPPNRAPAAALAAATGRRVVSWRAWPPPRQPGPLARRPGRRGRGTAHSGTTGVPKRVLVRQRPLAARAAAYAQALSLTPGSVYASAASFHHGAGVAMIAVALATGAALAPMPSRFSVAGWRALADLGVTHANVVPSMLQMLLDADALQVGSLRTLLYGASRIEPELARATMAALPGVDLVQGYGQTEGGPHTVLSGADHRRAVADPAHASLLTSCSQPAPGVRIRIVSRRRTRTRWVPSRCPRRTCSPPGWTAGSPPVTSAASTTRATCTSSSETGDGIVRGGENVHPAEIERVLLDPPRGPRRRGRRDPGRPGSGRRSAR